MGLRLVGGCGCVCVLDVDVCKLGSVGCWKEGVVDGKATRGRTDCLFGGCGVTRRLAREQRLRHGGGAAGGAAALV